MVHPVPIRTTEELLSLVESENVDLDPVDMSSHILGFYLRHPMLERPCIAVRRDIYIRQGRDFRTVVAEELFHHKTARGNSLRIITYTDYLLTCKDENRARREAAEYMCPMDSVRKLALRHFDLDELADYFYVRRELVMVQWERLLLESRVEVFDKKRSA